MSELPCTVCRTPLDLGFFPWHLRCLSCGYEQSTLTPSINAGEAHDKVDEELRAMGLKTLRQHNFETILSTIQPLSTGTKPKLLDVGAAHGWFLEAARRSYEAEGIEPDKAVYEATANRGLAVRCGFFPDILKDDELFDVIAFNDVIEHIPDIHATLEACRKHLNDNGLLVLNLPNSRGVFYRLSRIIARLGIGSFFKRMWQVGLPSPHVHYFHQENLQRLVEAHEFHLIHASYLDSFSTKGLFERVHHAGGTSKIYSLAISCAILVAAPLLKSLRSDIILCLFRKES